MKARDERKARPPSGEWSSVYFGPTTLVLAAVVLIGSIQVGKYVGTQLIARDDPQFGAPTVQTAPAPATHPSKMKVRPANSSAKMKALPGGKITLQAAPAVKTTAKDSH